MKSIKHIIAVMIFLSSLNLVFAADSDSFYSDDVSIEMINKVGNLNIFFGHQSVGENILDGILDHTSSFNLYETKALPDSGPYFSHAKIGSNEQPFIKIQDFSDIIVMNSDKGIDLAFLKLCYVDIDEDTDVKSLFDKYKSTMSYLEAMNPEIKFIHLTGPLTGIQTGIKAKIKQLLGRDVWGAQDNIKRQEYNQMIRAEYADTGLLFDIAEIESTKTDGSRMRNKINGYEYYGLVPEYTYDGGHLNEYGRKIVAAELIQFISEIEIE